jgi:hypothetical protein
MRRRVKLRRDGLLQRRLRHDDKYRVKRVSSYMKLNVSRRIRFCTYRSGGQNTKAYLN